MREPDGKSSADGDTHRQGSLHISLEDEFWLARADAEWSELAANSSANPLFMGWDWQSLWWIHFGAPSGARLLLITARDENGLLVAIAPFIDRRRTSRRLLAARQLSPLGNVWRINIGEVSEHLDWIVRLGHEEQATAAIADFLSNEAPWDEMLCAYTSPDSIICRAMQGLAYRERCHVRGEQPQSHYSANTTQGFAAYLARRSVNARRRIFGRRRILSRLGRVEVVTANETNLESHFDELDRLSLLRWSQGLPTAFRDFYRELATRCLATEDLRFSTLEIDGRAISVLLDIDRGDCRYNVRSAFDAAFDRRLSPGFLHIGFAIEAACADSGINRYDLLAGEGKQTDFKKSVADATGSFVSAQLLRRRHEKLLFAAYDAIFGRSR